MVLGMYCVLPVWHREHAKDVGLMAIMGRESGKQVPSVVLRLGPEGRTYQVFENDAPASAIFEYVLEFPKVLAFSCQRIQKSCGICVNVSCSSAPRCGRSSLKVSGFRAGSRPKTVSGKKLHQGRLDY